MRLARGGCRRGDDDTGAGGRERRREIELNVLDEILDGAQRGLLCSRSSGSGTTSTAPTTIIARVDATPGAPVRARDGRWSNSRRCTGRPRPQRAAPVACPQHQRRDRLPVADETELAAIIREVHDDLTAAVSTNGSSELVSMGWAGSTTGWRASASRTRTRARR